MVSIDIGFEVGRKTSMKYVVLEIHVGEKTEGEGGLGATATLFLRKSKYVGYI